MQVNSILLYPHTLIRNSFDCLLHNVYDVSLENLVLDQLIIP